VTHIIPRVLIRVDFYLGFKVEPQINLYFKEVIEDLKQSGEINTESSFETIRKHSMPADFLFILIDRIMPRDYKFTRRQSLILALHEFSRLFCVSDVKAFNLDSTNTIEEKVPILLKQTEINRIKRIQAPVSINKLWPN
jgi:KUP system potassium uptake protein